MVQWRHLLSRAPGFASLPVRDPKELRCDDAVCPCFPCLLCLDGPNPSGYRAQQRARNLYEMRRAVVVRYGAVRSALLCSSDGAPAERSISPFVPFQCPVKLKSNADTSHANTRIGSPRRRALIDSKAEDDPEGACRPGPCRPSISSPSNAVTTIAFSSQLAPIHCLFCDPLTLLATTTSFPSPCAARQSNIDICALGAKAGLGGKKSKHRPDILSNARDRSCASRG